MMAVETIRAERQALIESGLGWAAVNAQLSWKFREYPAELKQVRSEAAVRGARNRSKALQEKAGDIQLTFAGYNPERRRL